MCAMCIICVCANGHCLSVTTTTTIVYMKFNFFVSSSFLPFVVLRFDFLSAHNWNCTSPFIFHPLFHPLCTFSFSPHSCNIYVVCTCTTCNSTKTNIKSWLALDLCVWKWRHLAALWAKCAFCAEKCNRILWSVRSDGLLCIVCTVHYMARFLNNNINLCLKSTFRSIFCLQSRK